MDRTGPLDDADDQSQDFTPWWRRARRPGTADEPARRLPRQRSFLRDGDDEVGAGTGPRLVLHRADGHGRAHAAVFPLSGAVTTLGSRADCDIVLPGLESHHANLLNEYADEFELVNCDGSARVSGTLVFGYAILRSGTRIDVGPHTLTLHLV